jgi:hypothetical protein
MTREAPGAPTEPVAVALFAYRRPEQLARTLACLRDAGVERLYVFSDGPRDSAAADDVQRVRELVSSLDWIEPVTVARAENLGLSESIRSGLDQLFEVHDELIIIEDDVCVAPEFYDYACRALSHYASAERVAGITGLRYPFNRRAFDGYPFDVFLSPRFSSWSWATWKGRWSGFGFDLASLRREIAASATFRPQRAGADLPGMVDGAVFAETLTGSWDVVCATNMLLHGQYFVTPTWNMVENTGLSEGTHFSAPPPWQLTWEREHRPHGPIRFAPVEEYEPILRDYLRFFGPSRARMVRDRLSAATRRLVP